jgi:uncharacterized protein with von Willebrand factor type A (vWA) domain
MEGQTVKLVGSTLTAEANPDGAWAQLLRALEAFMSTIAQDTALNRAVRVSAIGYDDRSDILFENQPASPDLVQRISYGGGSTDFEAPLQDALKIISRHPDPERVTILFMSDGSAAYPSSVLQQLQ